MFEKTLSWRWSQKWPKKVGALNRSSCNIFKHFYMKLYYSYSEVPMAGHEMFKIDFEDTDDSQNRSSWWHMLWPETLNAVPATNNH